MADATHDYSKHKKTYMKVGIALGICTGLTLALGLSASLDFGPPGPTASDFVIGLCVASIKASLVALIFTFLFFIGLMTLTLFSDFDPIREQFETFKTTSGMLTEKP